MIWFTMIYTSSGRNSSLYKNNHQAKKHNGIDLAGPVGTPVYAMFDGEIGPKYITGQPDKIGNKYPDGYTGDKDPAGNRIYIESTIKGKSVMIGYMHLRAGNPVAINPRTGRLFAPGDQVCQGDYHRVYRAYRECRS